MQIKWVGCSPSNYSVGRGGKQVKTVVIHWIVGSQASCDATFADGRRQASAHYSVGQSEIHQYVKEEDTAWHAGNFGVNQESVGIEHEGGPTIPITEAVYNQSVELVADLCKRYSIPCDRDHIKKHKEVSDKVTECCGTLDIDRIVREAKLKLEAPVNPDQVKVDIGGDYGVMEVQAIRSKLNDLVRDLTSAQDKAKQYDSLMTALITEWDMSAGTTMADVIAESRKIHGAEEAAGKLRDSIELLVGSYDSDEALLMALQAIKLDMKKKDDQITELLQKLEIVKVPVGYKFWKSWDLFGGRYKIKMYRKEVI